MLLDFFQCVIYYFHEAHMLKVLVGKYHLWVVRALFPKQTAAVLLSALPAYAGAGDWGFQNLDY